MANYKPNKGSFKKGNRPACAKYDGCIVIRKAKDRQYKWVRISPGKWQQLHRYVWEQENGPIPERHTIRFINGDSLDVRIDNLELVKGGGFKKGVRYSPGTEFKKGLIPWNTGKKGIRNSPATEFKKGHLPINTKYDGCITVRRDSRGIKYKWIRISKANWKEYHRYIWEQENGPIPENHIIRFKNGNQLDVRIDNLECIQRKQNLLKNINRNTDKFIASTLVKKDPELRKMVEKCPGLLELKRQELKLRRAIRDTSRE
jgi:hypothetical protein